MRYLLSAAIALAAFSAGYGTGWQRAPRIVGEPDRGGRPRILDGNTVEIGGERIRLLGIDAPATEQVCLDGRSADWTCGIAAREALVGLSAGRAWRYAVRIERDRYGRLLGTCFIGSTISIAGWCDRVGRRHSGATSRIPTTATRVQRAEGDLAYGLAPFMRHGTGGTAPAITRSSALPRCRSTQEAGRADKLYYKERTIFRRLLGKLD